MSRQVRRRQWASTLDSIVLCCRGNLPTCAKVRLYKHKQKQPRSKNNSKFLAKLNNLVRGCLDQSPSLSPLVFIFCCVCLSLHCLLGLFYQKFLQSWAPLARLPWPESLTESIVVSSWPLCIVLTDLDFCLFSNPLPSTLRVLALLAIQAIVTIIMIRGDNEQWTLGWQLMKRQIGVRAVKLNHEKFWLDWSNN